MYSGLHDSCARDIPRMFHMEVTWLFTWLLVFFSLEVEGAETLFASVWRVSSSTHFPILAYVLVRALNRYGRGHGFVSRTSLIFFFFFFFRLSFRNCKTCLYNCNHRGLRLTTYWKPNYMALYTNLS